MRSNFVEKILNKNKGKNYYISSPADSLEKDSKNKDHLQTEPHEQYNPEFSWVGCWNIDNKQQVKNEQNN